MKKIEMIKTHQEFSEIIKNGYNLKNQNFSIYIRKGKYQFSHYGIAVPKKLGNAVKRNHLKRQMRVIIDEWKKELPYNEDYIIIMKENTKNISFGEMRNSFLKLMEKRRKNEKTK